MPKYQYTCCDCSLKDDKKIKESELATGDEAGYTETGEYIFVIRSKMTDKPKNPPCPKCNDINTRSSYMGYTNEFWVRGNGLVNDKGGARRDMNRHTLVNDDPYPNMRVSGEVDDMLDRMRRAGMDMTKVRSRSAELSREAKKKVMAEEHGLNDDQIKILMMIDESGESTMEDFIDFEDINGLLSKMMPDYIFKNKNGSFVLMAAGRKLAEELTFEEDY